MLAFAQGSPHVPTTDNLGTTRILACGVEPPVWLHSATRRTTESRVSPSSALALTDMATISVVAFIYLIARLRRPDARFLVLC